jgi:hypothetical protein
MIIRVIPLEFHRDFDRSGAVAMPRDPLLHNMLARFSEEHFVQQPNYAGDYQKVWVAAEVDKNEIPQAVHGVLGYCMRPDIFCRFLNPQAMSKLYHRANDWFSDNGLRGSEVLLYINPEENPKQKCANVEESLNAVGAVPSNRWLVEVR